MKSQILRKFILENLKNLKWCKGGGDGVHVKYPKFDLTPFDYIDFAEKELESNSERSKINCVGHLKRAVDCQLDVFLFAYNLSPIFTKNNLKFSKKLEVVSESNIFSTRSLNKLNTIRNKMDHEYSVPDIKDLELYFELSSAFVSVLENAIDIIHSNTKMIWEPIDEINFNGRLEMYYLTEKPEIEYFLNEGSKDTHLVFPVAQKEDFNEFLFALKVYYLLVSHKPNKGIRRILISLGKD